MHPFAYARPSTLSEALTLLDQHGPASSLLAGGTDLVVELRNRSRRPAIVIDLKGIKELPSAIEERNDRLTISPTVVMADIENDPRVRQMFPALADAAATVGSIQIRNRATLAGNICHASPAADTAPALLVYGAELELTSSRGRRRLALDDFFLGPGKTALSQGELVTAIDLPVPGRHGAAFARVTRRRGVDLATINLCCRVSAGKRTVFAFGAVGPRPFLVADDSGVLADLAASDVAKEQVLTHLLTRASPITDVRGSREYRAAMLLVMSRRALQTSLDRLAKSPSPAPGEGGDGGL